MDQKRSARSQAIAAHYRYESGMGVGATVNLLARDVDTWASKALGIQTPAQRFAESQGCEPTEVKAPMGRVSVNRYGELAPASRTALTPGCDTALGGAAITYVRRPKGHVTTMQPTPAERLAMDTRQDFADRQRGLQARHAAAARGRDAGGAER